MLAINLLRFNSISLLEVIYFNIAYFKANAE